MMEEFDSEDIETYGTNTIESRPKRIKKSHNYNELNDDGVPSPPLMDMNYEESWLSDEIDQKDIKTEIIEEDEKEETPFETLKLKCLICYKSFKHQAAFSIRNHFSTNYCNKVFNTLCHLLHLQDDDRSFQWDFDFNEFPLPFCTPCTKDVIGVVKLQQLIEDYQKSVAEVVHDIKVQILQTEVEVHKEQLDGGTNDGNEILGRYKDRINILRKSAINDFEPSSHPTTKSRSFATHTKPKRIKLENIEPTDLLFCDFDDEGQDYLGSPNSPEQDHQEKNKKFNLNPRVVLTKLKPHVVASALKINSAETSHIGKRTSALRAKEALAATLKPDRKDGDDMEGGKRVGWIGSQQITFDPEWSENDDEAHLQGFETSRKKQTKPSSSKKSKSKIPLIVTNDGNLLFGNVEIHKIIVDNVSKYQCSLCGDKTNSKELHRVKKHIAAAHLSNYKEGVTCDKCGKILRNKGSLPRHNHVYHSESSDKPRPAYQCDECGKTFWDSRSVTSHKILIHQLPIEAVDIPLYDCDICSRPLFFNKNLQVHRLTHMNEYEKYLEILRLKEQDPNFVLHECSHCGKLEACASSLKTHMMVHTNERPFQCHLCPQAFTFKRNLQSHIERHKDINERDWKFVCDFPGCNRRFPHKYDFVNHSYVHRPVEERPLQCTSCDARFVTSNELARHRRKHTGERYACEYCGKTFTQTPHLKRHYTNIHQIPSKDEMPTPRLINTTNETTTTNTS